MDTVANLLRLSNRLPAGLVAANTDREPLPGAVGWPADDDAGKVAALVREAAEGRIDEATARYLAERYGTRGVDLARTLAGDPRLAEPLVPGRPEILGQVDWAVREELAGSAADVLVRRTQLYFRDVDQGLGCTEKIAARMGTLLRWDLDRVAREVDGYRAEVRRSRAWKAPVD